MSKKLLEAAERLTEELSVEERLQLTKELVQRVREEQWDRLFRSIDRRRKGRRFTMAEIQREIDAVRLERRGVNHSRRR